MVEAVDAEKLPALQRKAVSGEALMWSRRRQHWRQGHAGTVVAQLWHVVHTFASNSAKLGAS